MFRVPFRVFRGKVIEMVRTLNIKDGLPTVEDGIGRLCSELACARQDGVVLVRVIHGYGSSGAGGTLRDACHACLAKLIEGGQILRFIPGDQYSHGRAATRQLMTRFPELKKSMPTDSKNYGITFIELPQALSKRKQLRAEGQERLRGHKGVFRVNPFEGL